MQRKAYHEENRRRQQAFFHCLTPMVRARKYSPIPMSNVAKPARASSGLASAVYTMVKRFSPRNTRGVSGYPKQRKGLGRSGWRQRKTNTPQDGQKAARENGKLGVN